MSVVFFVLLTIGLVLGAMAAWLIWRGRSAPPAAPAQAGGKHQDDASAPPPGWVATVLEALDYAHTRREWRYRLPWILLLGERGAGKTSFARSAKALAQSNPDRRYASLSAPGSVMSVMNRGVLIDVDGAVSSPSAPVPATDGALPASTPASASTPSLTSGATSTSTPKSKPRSRWTKLLSTLVDLRPERPVDGIVLMVSARTLLQTDPDTLDRLAADAYGQLCDVQDAFRFVEPVSVVVTQCDRVDGFAAFWRAQEVALRRQMFGWSAPALTLNDTPSAWCDAAFDAVTAQLRTLQLDGAERAARSDAARAKAAKAAAPHEENDAETADHDGMLLFPTRLAELRAPLAQWLSSAFRTTLDRPGHKCRGIYFTGDVEGAEVTACDDVAFVIDLLDRKVFVERGNARVVRASAWSRNRYLRAFQVAAVGCAAVLAIGLGVASIRLASSVGRLGSALAQFETLQPFAGGACPTASEVSERLMQVHELDTRSFHPGNPWSWFDDTLLTGAARVVVKRVFANIVLPGLACQLAVRANDLQARGGRSSEKPLDGGDSVNNGREALNAQLRAVTDLEASLGTFAQVAKPFSGASSEEDLNRFAQLVNFAYGLSPTLVLRDSDKKLFAAALSEAWTDHHPMLAANLADTYASQIERMEQDLRDALIEEAGAGQSLLADLSAGRGDPATQTRQLVRWLDWTRDNWLGESPRVVERNVCGQIRKDLTEQIRQLVLTDSSRGWRTVPAQQAGGGYTSPYSRLLDKTAEIFSQAACADPVYQKLTAQPVPPYDPLIVHEGSKLVFNPAFSDEFTGLTALAQQRFMQATQKREAFTCIADGTTDQGWNVDSLGDAAAYVEEYRRFGQRFPAAIAKGARPLYGQIASRQLENALNHALDDAQRERPPGPNVWPVSTATTALGPIPFDEQAFAQASRDLSRSLGTLVSVDRSYDEFDLHSYRDLSGCLQRFAASRLSTISSLTWQSQLYWPQTSGTGPEFYDLGTPAVTRDYLARQVSRAKVLAAYAAPFVTLSQNSGNAGNADRNAGTSAYWSNSIAEVNRYVPSNDPTSQLGQLASLFIERLNGMTAENCTARLRDLPASASDDANDLFADLRRSLILSATALCEGSDIKSYQQLFALFNATLAGRYPFVDAAAAAHAPDASPQAVRDFFDAYKQQEATLRDGLKELSVFPLSQQVAVRRFLDDISNDRKFFEATLRTDGSYAVHLNTTFNVAQNAEHGADQLIGWMLSSASQSASYPTGQTGLDWVAGQPLALDLTWADLSRWAPYANGAPPDGPDVEGRTATFTSGGTWALMRFVQHHATPWSDSRSDATTLHFSVPVATTAGAASAASASSAPRPASLGTAQLILSLQLQGVDPVSHTAMPLKLPVFPSNAPPLQLTRTISRRLAQEARVPAIPSLPPLPKQFDAGQANTADAN